MNVFAATSVQSPEVLSSSTLKQVKGGMDVQTFSVPSNNDTFYTDNVPLDVDLRHSLTSDTEIVVETNVNGSKVDSFIVSTPTLAGGWRYGTLQERMKWPLGEGPGSTLELKFCDINFNGCQGDPTGPDTKTGLSLPGGGSVKVVKLWFHNMEVEFAGSVLDTTSVSDAQIEALVDNTDFSYVPKTTTMFNPATNSVDAILEQCAVTDRLQVRHYKTDTLSALTLYPVGDNTTDQNFFDTMWDPVSAPATSSYANYWVEQIDPAREYFHVFFFKEIRVDFAGNGYDPVQGDIVLDGLAENDPPNEMNAVLIREDMSPFEMATILTHELGHAIGDFEHTDSEANPCGNDTSNPVTISNRNFMCGTRGAGRSITANQCDTLHSIPVLDILDFND